MLIFDRNDGLIRQLGTPRSITEKKAENKIRIKKNDENSESYVYGAVYDRTAFYCIVGTKMAK